MVIKRNIKAPARRRGAAVLLVGTMLCSIGAGQEEIFSGPQAGEMITQFRVLEVSSPKRVKEVEIAGRADDRAVTLLMFMHKLSEPAIGLMMTVEWYAAKQEDVASHFIMLTDDKGKSTTLAQRWAQRPFFSSSPMSISVDGLEGPGRYGLNRNIDMTVLVARNDRVVHNFAINGPNNTDAPEILSAIAKTINKAPPSFEKIRAELRANREKRRAKRLSETPVFKLAPNEDLGRLMVALVSRERVTEASVKETSANMKKWAGDDKKKQALIAEYAKKVLKGNFRLNRYAREALEEFSSR